MSHANADDAIIKSGRPGLRFGAIVLWAAACLSVLLAATAHAQARRTPLSAGVQANLDRYIAQVVHDMPLPGLAIAVVDRQGVLYMRGFGYRDLENRLPVTADTLFAAASTTKAFTAFAAGTLVTRGLIDWDTPIHARMPAFVLANPEATRTVTLRQLLSHSSGAGFHDLVPFSNPNITRAELVRRLRYLAMKDAPGAHYQYSNIMVAAAGEYLGHVAGIPVEELIRRTIFAPLHMDRTTFSLRRVQADPDHAIGYDYDYWRGYHYRVPMRETPAMAPAGGINASVRDYAKWLMLQLNDGRLGGRALISPAALAMIRSPQILIGNDQGNADLGPISYAMGWNVDTYRGMRRLHHSGINPGFTSRITLYPEQGIGIIIFTNQNNHYVPSWLSLDVADRLFGLEPRNWVAQITARQSRPGSTPAPAAAPPALTLSRPITDYAGVYTNPGYGRLTIAVEDGRLTATLNRVVLWLEPAGLDRFKTNTSSWQDRVFSELDLAFVPDAGHAPDRLTFKLDGGTGPEVFTRIPASR